ncbi:class I glutamine amidotransferase-like protein [Biscogniauxia sp. FL1348]|nr:class I glutamine amidotransferase-like protein [Biscogniauxia sp. FL1348]
MRSETATGPIRLAILEADTPVPQIKDKYGPYGEVFTYLFRRACDSLDPPQPLESLLGIKAYDVVVSDGSNLPAYPKLGDIDAVLITGAKHNAFEDREWILRLVAYTRECLDAGVPVVGICFGHQIVARALGAKVGRNERGWELSVIPCELTETGKKLFKLEKLLIQQMHQDIVYSVPDGVTQLAHTEVCPNQGMYQPGRLLTVQGHPEFTADMMRSILDMRVSMKIISEELYADGTARAADAQDGVAVARAFIRFFREKPEQLLK